MSDSKPHIVFVLCESVGWGDFSSHGGGTPTPRIDKRASEGIRFTGQAVGEFEDSVAQYPNIKSGEEFDGSKAPATTHDRTKKEPTHA